MRIDYSESLEKKRRCSEKIDFFCHCIHENMDHARHVENERMIFTSIYTATFGLAMVELFSNLAKCNAETNTNIFPSMSAIVILPLFALFITGLILLILTIKWNFVFNTHKDFAMVLHEIIIDGLHTGNLEDVYAQFKKKFLNRYHARDEYFNHMIMFYHMYPDEDIYEFYQFILNDKNNEFKYSTKHEKKLMCLDFLISQKKWHATGFFIIWDFVLIYIPLFCIFYILCGRKVNIIVLGLVLAIFFIILYIIILNFSERKVRKYCDTLEKGVDLKSRLDDKNENGGSNNEKVKKT